MIIDDDEGLIHFLTRFFQRKGYAVTSCLSGLAAIDLISEKQFDLILLDYKMPEMTGLEILAKVSQINPEISFVIITAYGTVENAVNAMHLGAYDYLSKPVNLDELDLRS